MVNDIIDGKYQLISKIGSGGTSVVYKALRLADNKTVAIKIVKEGLENNKENERHFYLEIEALYKMSHRNIRRILATGQWNESLYMVTEYIDGKTLKEIIAEGNMTLKESVDYALQIVAGIEHAHRKNIIHRDIKPQNVIVANDGTVKIVDFGIARMTSQTTRTMTGKDVVGSVHYLSPEQAKGTQVDHRSDIYSFGILLYEMFTGKVPFEGTEAVSIAMRHINQIPEPPQSINTQLSSGLNDIIVKCIQKDPENRYQTASELREDLLLYVANPQGFSVIKAENLQGREKLKDIDIEKEKKSLSVREYVMTEENEPSSLDRRSKIKENKKRVKSKHLKNLFIIGLCSLLVILLTVFAINIIPKLIFDAQKYESKYIPDVSGKTKDASVQILKNTGFLKTKFLSEESNVIEEGLVIRTEPQNGNIVEVDKEVTIYISSGPERVTVKNVVGKTEEEAKNILTEQGFTVKTSYVKNTDVEEGTVVEQSNTTTVVKFGDTITISVAKKETMKKITVPDLMGMKDIDEIKNKIISAGFKVGNYKETAVSNSSSAGVSWQSITAGKEYSYLIGTEPPSIQIDFEINVANKCVYEFETPDGQKKDFNLIIYNSSGEQVDERNFSSTNNVVFEFSAVEEGSYTFELYVDNQLVDKKTLNTGN